MRINKQDLSKWTILFLASLASISIVLMTEEITWHLSAITIFVFLAVFFSKLDFCHPFFWYSTFSYLYACAYMIILIINPSDRFSIGYSKDSSLLIIVSIAATLLVSGAKNHTKDYINLQDYDYYYSDVIILERFFYILITVFVVSTVALRIQGVTSKSEQWARHNILWIISTYCTRFIVFIDAILLFLGEKKKKLTRILLVSLLSLLFFSLMTGERDAILRLLIVLLLSFTMIGKITKLQLLIFIPCGVLLMIFLNAIKYFFSSGTINSLEDVPGNLMYNILYAFLSSDFSACGYNIHRLLFTPGLEGIRGYGTLIKDVLSAFIPTSILIKLFGSSTEVSTSAWYIDLFYKGSSWNRDFTLIGEGYVIDGLLGVIVLFSVIGLLIKIMYFYSSKNPYGAAFYAYGASVVIASFRGDAASIFQALFRIPILLLIIIWICKRIKL